MESRDEAHFQKESTKGVSYITNRADSLVSRGCDDGIVEVFDICRRLLFCSAVQSTRNLQERRCMFMHVQKWIASQFVADRWR